MIDYVITGGEGFIGKNLVSYLKKNESSFVVLDKQISKNSNYMKIDVSDKDFLQNSPFMRVSSLIHLAAFTNVRDSVLESLKCFIENSRGTINCLEYAKDLKINHFIFASSIGSVLSKSPYSASKLAGEGICKAYRESYGMNVSIIKFSNIYGPHSAHKSSVIPTFIKNILKREPLQVFGTGEQTRDFLFVDDAVRTIVSIPLRSDTFTSFGHSITINQLIETLKALSKRLINYVPEVRYLPPKKGEVLRIDSESDINPSVGLEEGLEKTFKWFLDTYDIFTQRPLH